MSSDMLDLLIQSGLGNFALFNVHNQSVVGANEANVESLFKFIPLASNHDTVPVTIGLGAGHNRRHQTGIDAAQTLKQIAHLFVLQGKLGRVIEVLILASTTI